MTFYIFLRYKKIDNKIRAFGTGLPKREYYILV